MLHSLLSIIILIGITSCSTTIDKKSKDSLTLKSNNEGIDERPLCKYTEVKGISELVSINSSNYNFIFFPGDNQFEMSKIDIFTLFTKVEIEYLHTQKEIKSIKRKLILGHKKCNDFEFELMPF